EQATTISMSSPNFDGTLNPPAVGTQGWALGGPNAAAVFNEILLRGGIIGNDALTNPVTALVKNGFSSGISFGMSAVSLHSETVTVPAGFTQAHVLAVCPI